MIDKGDNMVFTNYSDKLKGNRCQCTVCSEVFSTEANFDRHRKGEITKKKCDFSGLKKNRLGIWVKDSDFNYDIVGN